MNRFYKYLVLFGIVCISACLMWGRDDSQSDLRENPEMEAEKADVYTLPSIDYPSFINLNANYIDMNGADWTELAALFDSAHSSRVNIVHIGDSHLQADMATAVSRNRFGKHYGSAGRALVTPFKLAGTNEPVDYSIVSNVAVEQSRLLKTPWPTAMGFTGIGVRPLKNEFELTVSAQEPFDSIAIFYTGDSLCVLNQCRNYIASGLTTIALDDTCSTLSLHLKSLKTIDIHGFNLIRGKSGIAYHVIGNNGATYGSYNGIRSFTKDIASLCPSLIIISLGTNEAFGKTSDFEMKMQMKSLVSGLRATCPDAYFLLTTPAECQRRSTRGRGKKRRTSYSVNTNVKRLRNVILDYGRDEGIPVYDFYAVAGGDGSSTKWLNSGNMNKDRIHLLRSGYTLQGNLFTDALENAVDDFRPAE